MRDDSRFTWRGGAFGPGWVTPKPDQVLHRARALLAAATRRPAAQRMGHGEQCRLAVLALRPRVCRPLPDLLTEPLRGETLARAGIVRRRGGHHA